MCGQADPCYQATDKHAPVNGTRKQLPPERLQRHPRRSRHIPVLRQRCGLHSQHLAVHVDQRYIQPRRLRHWTGRLSFRANHPCQYNTCVVPTCTACTQDNEEPCDVGQLCTNGCCGKQQCSVGAIPPHNLACQSASNCESGYCNSGCCANCEPGTNVGCTGGDVCTNGDCVAPPPGCLSQAMPCSGNDCCSGLSCLDGGFCLPSGSPIVLDAFKEGYHLTSLNNGVQFRVLPGGPLQQMSWTNANWRNGWLSLDRNGDGTIDDFTELFGNYTAQPPSNTPNGFLALAVFDNPANGGNGNGFIDPGDAVYSHLWVWIDSNHNGISEPNELHTLQELGIFKIGLKYHSTPFVDQYGNQFRFKGSFWDESDNEKDLCYDVFLQIQAP